MLSSANTRSWLARYDSISCSLTRLRRDAFSSGEHEEMRGDRLETVAFPSHVLIIGGGLGGLCLAQGLKKSGFSVAVYERESSAQFRNQGYRISIKQEGSQALRDCLPERLFQLCVATALKTATRLVLLDQELHLQFARSLPHSPIPDGSGFGVNRLMLREILLADLEDVVHFGKTCERFDQVDGGQVRASFADGTTATGDLLVGADGTHSVIRALIAPDARIDTLHYAIYGKETTTFGPITITASPGKHRVPEITYLLQAGGFTVYFGGDTLLIPALSEIPQRFPQVDVALLAINGLQIRFLGNRQDVMNPQDAAEFCRISRPRYAVPIHYTFTGGPIMDALALKYAGTPQELLREFQQAAAKLAPETTVRILAPGEPLQVTTDGAGGGQGETRGEL
jgi:L-ascorbate metabolism protein UlaG (beta-lactamase superfamily)